MNPLYANRLTAVLIFTGILLAACGGDNGEPDPQELGSLDLQWSRQEIGEGIKPALALDAEGSAHVAYLTEEEMGGLFYATNSGGPFAEETVAQGYFYGPVDIAVSPEGIPFIAYHDHQSAQFMPELGDEVVAVRGGEGWVLSVVAHEGHDGWDNSITLDASGGWHTAAVDPEQFGGQSGVEYATNTDGPIRVEEVGSGPIAYEFSTSVQIAPDGSPAVAYYDSEENQLEYAQRGTAGWAVEVVDAEGDAGRYAALAFDPNGAPHIAYFVAQNGERGIVRHAWKVEDSTVGGDGDWQIEDVDVLDDIRMGQVGARKITALAFDADGVAHIAYTDRSRIMYGQRSDEGWSVQTVETAGERPLGQLVEMALDANGQPHLVWFQPSSFSPILMGTVVYAVGTP